MYLFINYELFQHLPQFNVNKNVQSLTTDFKHIYESFMEIYQKEDVSKIFW